MSLFGSLSGGVSGLLSQSESISVISDNLANVNTIGYKNTRTLFDQQVTSTGLSGTLYNTGGVGTNFERFQAAQGAFLSTQSSTDLALSGNGVFVVVNDTEITNDTSFFYSRAGAFAENNLGFLTTPDGGGHLVGWRTDSDGTITNLQDTAPIELQSVGSSARASSALDLGLNLTSTESIHTYNTTGNTLAQELAGIVATPANADFVSDVRLFDSEGGARDVTAAFIKRADNFWDYTIYTDGANIVTDSAGASVAAGTNGQIGSGTLEFNRDGSLKYATGTSLSIDWAGGVEDGSITINFGDYTGGNIFNAPGAGVQHADHVLGFTLDESDASAPTTIAGNYVLVNNGAVAGGFDIQLTDPDLNVFNVTVPNSGGNPQMVEFGNGVAMGLSGDWTGAGFAGGTVTMPATAQAALDVGRGTDGVIQFAADYNNSFGNQDGFGSGTLSAVSIDEDGFVIGSFTNGEAKKLWKIVVAVFQDPSELEPVGGSLMRETDGSGRPLYKEAGVGGTATIVSGALEQSTVDIANEFSSMIVSQRAFQASSTIISTVDQMLNELLQLR